MGSNIDWNADSKKVLIFYRRLLGILGLWVFDEGKIFSRIRWFITTSLEFSTTVTLSLEVIRHCKGYDDAFNAFLMGCSSISSFTKLLLHRVNWKYKLILVKSIIQDWSDVKNPYSREIMLKYARRGRLGSSLYFYFWCCSMVPYFYYFTLDNLSWTSEQTINNETYDRTLILEAYCVFSKYTVLIPAYACIAFLQMLELMVNTFAQSGSDGLFFDLTMHLCGQFEILRVDFVNMVNNEVFSRSKFEALLKRHYQLIHLAYYLEKAFSLAILSTVFFSVLMFVCEGFQILTSLENIDTNAIINHGIFISCLTVQLFTHCLAGQTLEFQSEELTYAIFESSWYNHDLSTMKSLSLIMLRTAHPHQLTAGKFLILNYMSFKEILKASASYLSVLRVMLES